MYLISQEQLNAIRALCQTGTQAHGDEFYEPIMEQLDKVDRVKGQVLLIKDLKGRRSAQLFDDAAYAEQLARKFVGDHNPVDGCSSEPRAESYGGKNGTVFYISRSSSFGTRRAHVMPIGTGFEQELRI